MGHIEFFGNKIADFKHDNQNCNMHGDGTTSVKQTRMIVTTCNINEN